MKRLLLALSSLVAILGCSSGPGGSTCNAFGTSACETCAQNECPGQVAAFNSDCSSALSCECACSGSTSCESDCFTSTGSSCAGAAADLDSCESVDCASECSAAVDAGDTSCGAQGETCCGGSSCNTGLKCTIGVCAAACGSAGGSCCNGSACGAGLTCQLGTCTSTTSCGADGESCCAGSACNSGLTCDNGVCDSPPTTCGADEEECCAGSVCNAGLECSNGSCGAPASCGALDEACCTGEICNSGLVCSGDACVSPTTCGALDEDCCAGSACNSGLTCSGGACVTSSVCGAQNEACCNGTACNTGLTCTSGVCGTPAAACGALDEVCCDGSTCNAGLSCNTGACVTVYCDGFAVQDKSGSLVDLDYFQFHPGFVSCYSTAEAYTDGQTLGTAGGIFDIVTESVAAPGLYIGDCSDFGAAGGAGAGSGYTAPSGSSTVAAAVQSAANTSSLWGVVTAVDSWVVPSGTTTAKSGEFYLQDAVVDGELPARNSGIGVFFAPTAVLPTTGAPPVVGDVVEVTNLTWAPYEGANQFAATATTVVTTIGSTSLPPPVQVSAEQVSPSNAVSSVPASGYEGMRVTLINGPFTVDGSASTTCPPDLTYSASGG